MLGNTGEVLRVSGAKSAVPHLSWHSNGRDKVIVMNSPSLKDILRVPNSVIAHLFLWDLSSTVCPQG